MEMGPILRALFQNKTRFWLITLEIALTLAIVVNCVNVILDNRERMNRPPGLDVDNILTIESQPFAADFEDEDYARDSAAEDLRVLSAIPGVRSASAVSATPLSGSGSATGRKILGQPEDTSTTFPYMRATAEILDTLGVELIEGRLLDLSDYPDYGGGNADASTTEEPQLNNVLLTVGAANRLFPDGDALGRQISNRTDSNVETVVGIVGHMHGFWPTSSVADRMMFFAGNPASERRTRYLVRVEPGMIDEVFKAAEVALLDSNAGRIVMLDTMTELKERMYSDLVALDKMFLGVSVLLVFVTSLGIIGMTSFSVTQRTKQIGTRRALGATRLAILRYFLIENWILTGIGLTLGIALSYSLNFALANLADAPKISFAMVGAAMLVLWVVGLLAALAPALRGTLVPPVIATQSV